MVQIYDKKVLKTSGIYKLVINKNPRKLFVYRDFMIFIDCF